MSQPPEFTEHRTERRLCKRGCVRSRRHLPDCEDRDTCRGCLPRDAEYGYLCQGCHKRLVGHLMNVAGQVELMHYMAGLVGEHELTAESKTKISTMWRTDTSQTLLTLYAKGNSASFASTEPYRLAVADCETEIMDILGLWAVQLVNNHDLTCRERYAPAPYAQWIRRHVGTLESDPAVGDKLEAFSEVMSRAHSLAPWRLPIKRLHGVPCPDCSTTALVLVESESYVTCLRCEETMSEQQYTMWTRVLAEERREQVG